jgi:hypothetical protein
VGVDYRLIALGALLPLLIDLPFGHMAIGHSLVLSIGVLGVIMLATIRRPRLLRRRLLCIPIGMMAGLLLSGAWSHDHVFWWPFLGTGFGDVALIPSWGIVAIEEVVGLFAIWWMTGIGSLYEPGPRSEFFRTGRLRDIPQAPG